MSRSTRSLVLLLLAAVALGGCPNRPKPDPVKDAGLRPTASAPVATLEAPADAVHGKELVLTFQCNRCHDGTGHPAAADAKHCVHCHKNILDDKFEAPAATIARWKPRIKELADAPSLEATGKRLSRKWLESYLLRPSDLRPHLHQYMPRLAISPSEARDVAAYLVPDADPVTALKSSALDGADLGKGRHLLESKGCGSCHAFTGVVAVPSSTPPTMDGRELERGRRLAPDLRFARERMPSATKMMAWLEDPRAIKGDTPMPKIALTKDEVRDLVAYILTVEITPPQAPAKFARLPVLERRVTFKEVDEKVFHRTCWHCHSEPDYAIGDGGPGNSGGLGFRPRGLNLSDYNGIAAGYLDDKGERASIFAKELGTSGASDTGVPRIVRALLARHDEEGGAETGPVRGMPLGYDPLSAEDIQLVETWAAQGRPR